MKVRATRPGTWPAGVHWSEGKVRDLDLGDDKDLPAWLVEVKPGKAKTKTKTKTKAAEPAAPDAG